MTNKYEYEPWQKEEIERVIRKAFPPATPLKRVSLGDDFGGVDAEYVVSQCCPLALRARIDRPAYAADSDITFRHTEPSKISAGTYAPIAVFVWFTGHRIVAGWLVDIYTMAHGLIPSWEDRPCYANKDGLTGFICVEIGELHKVHALLKRWDGDTWSVQCLGGEVRLQRILAEYQRRRA